MPKPEASDVQRDYTICNIFQHYIVTNIKFTQSQRRVTRDYTNDFKQHLSTLYRDKCSIHCVIASSDLAIDEIIVTVMKRLPSFASLSTVYCFVSCHLA